MEATLETVQHIAKLTRIELTQEEAVSIRREFNAVLKLMEQLEEVDVTDVTPLVTGYTIPLRMRADKVTDGNIVEEILANAPQTQENFFVVPKIVE